MCKVIADGGTYAQAYKVGGISETTFYAWMEKNAEFKEAIEKAKATYEDWLLTGILDSAKKSLKELIEGSEYEEVKTEYESREVVNEETGKKEFKPVIKKQVRTQKRVVPNVEAIKFLLTNRDPQNWKNRIDTMQMGNISTDLHVKVVGDSNYQFPSSESEVDAEPAQGD